MMWDDDGAALAKARKDYPPPPCPNCGAPGVIDFISIGTTYESRYMPGVTRCSARCYEQDPDGYLRAIKEQK